ncbi:hypothetical protein PTTG_27736 [Puccinia triticina 1-1 BBBD Race 1]|uniref:Uncharacterized protein n=1 Tax=Puccinia triticina (isolate 1-1 / race 1 (BBBD)) TaxID=630390 RepID=A0A180GIK7_PUCT1|nr:hypothetical protein PTTG_27736 [Puccinia triticina 1-1 BBBD Race 1]WAR53721.1 hypothetical protein PtB15_3B230 [Puccinia triticina]
MLLTTPKNLQSAKLTEGLGGIIEGASDIRPTGMRSPIFPASSQEKILSPSPKTEGTIIRSPEKVSVSSADQASRAALGEKMGQTSPEVTSQSAYRQILDNIGKSQVQAEAYSKGRIRDNLNRWIKPKTALHIDPADEAVLQTFLRRINKNPYNLNNKDTMALNEYYRAFSASNRKSTALVQLNPEAYSFLSKWGEKFEKGAPSSTQSTVHNFFRGILSEKEFLRRQSVLESQMNQVRIVAEWEKQAQTISKALGHSIEEVHQFGNTIGGKDFFTSFSGHNFKKTLEEFKALKREKPQLAKAWETFLGTEEYNARLELLKTLSWMKEPTTIPSETISAWRAQGLDVKRMLKIVNYNPRISQLHGPKLEIEFKSPKDYESAKETFLSKNKYGIPCIKEY